MKLWDWKLSSVLASFKQRYDIHENAVQGERLSANDAATGMFHTELQKFVQEENLKLDEIYNANESGLHWKGLPTTPAVEREKCGLGYKSSKERLTVMCCGNASRNHKLKLVVIGKAKKP
jgi:hypothetical protein